MTSRLAQIITTQWRPRQTTLILEGLYGHEVIAADPAEAITSPAGEFAYMAALGKLSGARVIAAEPDQRSIAGWMLSCWPELPRDELALHYMLKTLACLLPPGQAVPLETVAADIHVTAGIAGAIEDGGWVETPIDHADVPNLTDEGRSIILAELPQVIHKLNAAFASLTSMPKLVELTPAGQIILKADLTSEPVAWDPAPGRARLAPTILTEISQMDMLARDRHFFSLALRAVEQGQNVILVVGRSHISTLSPAFAAAFNDSTSTHKPRCPAASIGLSQLFGIEFSRVMMQARDQLAKVALAVAETLEVQDDAIEQLVRRVGDTIRRCQPPPSCPELGYVESVAACAVLLDELRAVFPSEIFKLTLGTVSNAKDGRKDFTLIHGFITYHHTKNDSPTIIDISLQRSVPGDEAIIYGGRDEITRSQGLLYESAVDYSIAPENGANGLPHDFDMHLRRLKERFRQAVGRDAAG